MTSAPFFKLSDLMTPGSEVQPGLITQHLIDPTTCFRCNTCESVCPSTAISHRSNYAVNAALCTACGDCVADCPTGAIDHWISVAPEAVFSVDEQFSWNELPALPDAPDGTTPRIAPTEHKSPSAPRSAATPKLHLFDLHHPLLATIASNDRLTPAAADSAVHHIVLSVGDDQFPVLEGQTLGVIPPGLDADGRPHYARAYSVASDRDGENAGSRDIALTVKRVTATDSGSAPGVASNYLCDLQPGERLNIVGPFGASFLMPEDPQSRLLMICTGTGIAPMRAMIQRRLRQADPQPQRLSLFYGGRTRAEMTYVAALEQAQQEGMDLHLALSREPDQPRHYVQDLIREQGSGIVAQLRDPDTYLYLCGLRSMEAGIDSAFGELCRAAGLSWTELAATMRAEGRLHIETY
jgi:benzoyl-CoA 2,3-dioxygenase component A